MSEVLIRTIRPGDGAAQAVLWREMGSLFAAANPHTFHVPDEEGLAEWFEEHIAAWTGGQDPSGQDPNTQNPSSQDRVTLVAEVDGALAGTVTATLHEPVEGAVHREIQTDLAKRRLHIDSLGVLEAHRRAGIGTVLMEAAEEWGRSRGAEVVILETEINNTLSVPFYKDRMGYTPEVFVFRKDLTSGSA